MTNKKELKEEVVETPKTAEENITIAKSDLEEMLLRIKRLEYAASKASLSKWDERHKDQMLKQCKIMKYNDKIVVGWTKMIQNKCEKLNGIWSETQISKLIYEDESTEEVDYDIWQRGFNYIPATIIAETTNFKGDTVFEVELEDGKKLKINSTFVN